MIDELAKLIEELPPHILIGRIAVPFTLKRAPSKIWVASYEDYHQVWKEARGRTASEAVYRLKNKIKL